MPTQNNNRRATQEAQKRTTTGKTNTSSETGRNMSETSRAANNRANQNKR